ncbi:MAG: patatin-like phospholipase family protein [Bacilli bacterium]|nr:patatin-like phospholipase family protein [Bacilli bacterium]
MIGIAFEGGGTRGSYQIGSYLAFLDCHIKPNGVCGTSIGSFNAAMIAAGQEKELLKFWEEIDVSELLDLQHLKKIKLGNVSKAVSSVFGILKNKGIDTTKLCNAVDKVLDRDKLYNSKMDYGLVTVQLNTLKPVYKYKEDIPKSKIIDYILASCYLPVFKMEKIIDENYYLDGGFYDNSPVDLLVKKKYKKIYVVRLNGIGVKRKRPKGVEIIDIKPSRSLGGTITLKQEKIRENIKLGYFDTLKVLKNYDGKKFLFKVRPDWYYNMLIKKVDEKLLKRVSKFWETDSAKEMILKSLEFIMREEKISYFNVYSPYGLVKLVKKAYNKKYFIYKFIKSLKFI